MVAANAFIEQISEVRALAYHRVSRDEDGESESIDLQKRVVLDFCRGKGIEPIESISDNNMSGYNFKTRKGLLSMISLIESGNINTIITKDLSRLGRHQAHTLLLLDFFKENGVRLLLVTDDYDSDDGDDEMVGIKTWINEMYIKDISKKTKKQLMTIQKEDGLVALPPYGFIKEKKSDGSTMYSIHPEMGETVLRIYEMYLDGMGYKAIAVKLTRDKIPTPQNSIDKAHNVFKPDKAHGEIWYGDSVRKMLENEAYYGTLVNRKSIRNVINKRCGKEVPKEERFYHENFFPAIITKEMFDRVQRERANRNDNNYRVGISGIQHPFTGILKCAECGSNLVFKTNSYVCATYHKFGKDQCTTHRVNESQLNEIVMDEMKRLFDNALINHEKLDAEIKRAKKSFTSYNSSIAAHKEKLLKVETKMERILDEKFEGRMSEELVNKMIEKAQQEYNNINEQIKQLEDLKAESGIDIKDLSKSTEILKLAIESDELSRNVINLVIDRIEVSQEKIEQQSGKRYKVDLKIVWRTPFLYNEGLCPSERISLLYIDFIKNREEMLAIYNQMVSLKLA